MVTDLQSESTEKSEIVQWLASIFGTSEILFEEPDASERASNLVALQELRWRNLLDIFSTGDGRLRETSELFRQYLDHALGSAREISTSPQGKSVLVSADRALITQDVSRTMVQRAQQFPALAFAFLISKLRRVMAENSDQEIKMLAMMSSMAELIDAQTTRNEKTIDALTAKRAEQFQRSLEQATSPQVANLKEVLKKFEDALLSSKDLLAAQNSAFDTTQAAQKQWRKSWETEKDSHIEAIRKEALEFAKIESSVHLWRKKARWHLLTFAAMALVFSVTLVMTPIVILERGVPFISDLAKSFAGDKEYLGLALLIIPAIAVGWLLRFIARIAIQNLSLSQDAQQRNAQIETYLRLLGDSRQPISKDERILALSAIFRPLSGQGLDDVNPPTVADLLREGFERVTSPK